MGGVHVVQLAAVLAAVSFVVVGSSAIDVAGGERCWTRFL
jgi:hypothetical protein